MPRIVIVPGLAVRDYARPPALALTGRGHDVSLLAPPAWRQTRVGLADYGDLLAAELTRRDEHVDLLIGLSVGTQAAAVAGASASDRVARMLLVSPTVDPSYRSPAKLLARWVHGDPDDGAPGWKASVPDWRKAGIPRIAAGFASALMVPIEDVLPGVAATLTIAHAEHDSLGTEDWAQMLAAENGASYRFLPGQPHSWPVDDDDHFVAVVEEVLA